MTSLQAKALLFDMDGTLIDSSEAANRAWDEWGKRMGVATPVLNAKTHGQPREGVVRIVLPDIQPEEVDEHAEYIRVAELNDVDGVIALPGAYDLLHSLPPNSWAIVTSCDREVAEKRLAAAGLPLPLVMVPVDELTHGKPDPEGYLKAAQTLGAAPQDVIVFEDAPAGLEAARRAGMRAIAGRHTAEDDELKAALVIIDDPSKVQATVASDGTITITLS